MPKATITRLVSGGQTGVDRATLDAAIELDIPHGGWCPLGRRAEDGVIDARYQLTETDSSDYRVRTERNVIDSDATLILCRGPLSGGTLQTQQFAEQHQRPCLVVELTAGEADRQFAEWLAEHDVRVLNVAGPRESGEPGIYEAAITWLIAQCSHHAPM